MTFNLAKSAHRLEALPRPQFAIASIAAILLIGVLDHLTGPITSLTIFYLMPVAAAAWVLGSAIGNAMALFAALTWALADRIGPYAKPSSLIGYWDDVSILIVFVVINVVLGILHDQMMRQRAILQDVQRRLLPEALPNLGPFDLACRWKPAWTVAGDYYDVIAGDGTYAICVADVSGKGMPAALIMSNVQATVRALTAEGMSPRNLVANLNRVLFERVRRGSFVTLFYCVIDTANGDLTYVNAGQNPPLLGTHEGAISQLASTGPVAGVIQGAHYTEKKVHIRPGDMLVIYSDGVTEYENAAGEQFGEGCLREVLGEETARSADDVCTAVFTRLNHFGGRMPYNDDVTLVVLSRRMCDAVPQAAIL